MTKTATTTPESIFERAQVFTPLERAALARAWRWQFGGGAAMNVARRTAIEAQRDTALKALREAARNVSALEGEFGDRSTWNAANAAQCVSETALAVSVADLADSGGALTQRHVEILLTPWQSVIGDV